MKKMLKTIDDVMNKIWNEHKRAIYKEILNVCKIKANNCDYNRMDFIKN